MSNIQIIILACVAAILFMAYLLIGLLSKNSESLKADHSNTLHDLK